MLRSLLTALLIFGLAAAPLAPVAAAPAKAVPAKAANAEHMSKHAGMPGCHGMKVKTDTQKPAAKKTSHRHCPDCEKGACAGDLCALKCFKVFARLPYAPEVGVPAAERFTPAVASQHRPISLQPQPPPPRA